MNDQISSPQANAFAFAKQHRRWLLTGLFAVCLYIVPSTATASTGWKVFGGFTSLLLGVAVVGQLPLVYARLSSRKKLILYGLSVVGLLFLGLFWVTGNSLAKSEAEIAVTNSLKDPDSARFGEFYINKLTGKGCLVVNARNSMGGYTGDQVAYISRNDGQFQVTDIKYDNIFDICKEQADPPKPVVVSSADAEAAAESAASAASLAADAADSASSAAVLASSANQPEESAASSNADTAASDAGR